MPVSIKCRGCNTVMRLADELRGKKIRCKKCRAVLVVPDGESNSRQTAIQDSKRGIKKIPRKVDADDDARPAPVRRQQGGLPMMPILLIGGGLVFVLFVVCAGGGGAAYWFWGRTPAPVIVKELPKDPPKVEEKKTETPTEAVTITFKNRPIGEPIMVAQNMKSMFKMRLVDAKGKEIVNSDVEGGEFQEFKEIVLERVGDKSTKVERLYVKAQKIDKDNKTDLPVADRTVLIEKKGAKFQFSYKEGGAVPPEFERMLAGQFSDKGDSLGDSFSDLFPKTPIKQGDTWTPAPAALKKLSKDGDISDAKATGTLQKIYKQDGRQFGVMEVKIEAPLKEIGKGKKGAMVFGDTGKMVLELNMDVCIDGSSELGTIRVSYKMSGDGTYTDIPGARVTLSSGGEMMATATAVPKK